jgi:hypothetical protein
MAATGRWDSSSTRCCSAEPEPGAGEPRVADSTASRRDSSRLERSINDSTRTRARELARNAGSMRAWMWRSFTTVPPLRRCPEAATAPGGTGRRNARESTWQRKRKQPKRSRARRRSARPRRSSRDPRRHDLGWPPGRDRDGVEAVREPGGGSPASPQLHAPQTRIFARSTCRGRSIAATAAV